MTNRSLRAAVAAPIFAAVLAAVAGTATAHVTLEAREAKAGSTYKATLRVPHGCEGSTMIRMRVQIPEGAIGVKPQPKAGWELTTVKGKLAVPYDDGHGGKVTEGVTEVSWSGGKLPDDHYDEFALRLTLPKTPNTTIYFPVVQECEKGANRWIEIPKPGEKADGLKQPAPALRLVD